MAHSLYPCLWFDGKAKEAASFYCSVFKETKIISENPMVVIFEMMGKRFMALNGGPHYKFSEAVSFVVECENQEEIDYFWTTFTREGEESRCGWLKDKYGLSWQIIPKNLGALMNDPARAERVGKALLKMNKLDIKVLESA
jgi:predicted 3-demethylubiquinone-9 3-methyltransferase (glyoxalase superfamily)